MNNATLALQQLDLPRIGAHARMLLRQLSGIEYGTLTVHTPEATTLKFKGRAPGPVAEWRVLDWRVCKRLLTHGDVGFGESYIAGEWDTPDLSELLTLAAANSNALEKAFYGSGVVRWLLNLRHRLRANTRKGSRRNIEAHYDLGNDFYSLWLDRTMTYSAARFDRNPARDLAAAQEAKYERILEKLAITSEHHILEIGCGWGGFATYAARQRGCRVTGLTLSPSQLEWAQRTVQEAGVADLVDLQLRDYRDETARFSHVVSIEMFEAVGEAYWDTFFNGVHDRLLPGGQALLQVISIEESAFDQYRRGSDFIQQYIFPGGMLPSRERFTARAGQAGLDVRERKSMTRDYALTLRHWRDRFDLHADRVQALGYDINFRRLWRFYLAYCEAGFNTGRTHVDQWHLARA